jgi:putative phosphoserine phosphatase/1-acylglycerol-3-phosphate O-acyltransferase
LHDDLVREIREGPEGPKVGAFFDLDRSLLAGFSALAFLRERAAEGRVSPRELFDSTRGALAYTLGRTGFSGMLTASTAAYRGISESVFEEIGETVFEKHLAGRVFPESRALVRAHAERGHTLAIVSSATRYQAEPLARELGIPHVLCTRLEVKHGMFTGRVERPTCWGEGKLTCAGELAQREGVELDESYFYTDSIDDLPLLEAVGRPRPLNPDRKLAGLARDRGWPVRRFTSRGQPGIEPIARTALAYGSVLPVTLAGLGVALLNRSRRDGVNLMASTWADVSTAIAGVDLRIVGEEHLWSHRPAVFIFNHQSGVDTLLVAKLLRRDFTGVGKQELRRHPVFGPLFAFAGMVFIDRSDSAKAIQALAPAVEALREGRSIAIAPEGTRSRTPKLGKFKKGAFHLALQARVPIVPIVFRNALDVLPRGALVLRSATVEVVVLPPVDTRRWKRATLDARIEEVRASYREVLGTDA